jgi:sirohydrochlorin ferrochelatase
MYFMCKGIVLVDHGSRVVAANQQVHIMAQLLNEHPEFLQYKVVGAHMEIAQPSIQEQLEHLVKQGCKEVLVIPYMLTPGKHARKDIPEQVHALQSQPQFQKIALKVSSEIKPVVAMCQVLLDCCVRPAESSGKPTVLGSNLP